MKPTVLFIITGDPRKSPRPAEAIRIAAGVGAWKKAEIMVCLREAAVLALGEFADELVDGDHFTRYAPIVREFGRPVYVQAGNPLIRELGAPVVPWEELDDAALARLAAHSTYVMRF